MRKISASLLFTFFMILAALTSHAQETSAEKKLRHVVLFKFKDTSKAEEITKVEKAFRELSGKLSIIKDFEWGTNSSPENLNQGLTHCFLVTFTSDKDRDTYLTHPDHQAFVEILKPHLDKVTVIDYWTR